jgi:hypothetical protein
VNSAPPQVGIRESHQDFASQASDGDAGEAFVAAAGVRSEPISEELREELPGGGGHTADEIPLRACQRYLEVATSVSGAAPPPSIRTRRRARLASWRVAVEERSTTSAISSKGNGEDVVEDERDALGRRQLLERSMFKHTRETAVVSPLSSRPGAAWTRSVLSKKTTRSHKLGLVLSFGRVHRRLDVLPNTPQDLFTAVRLGQVADARLEHPASDHYLLVVARGV